MPNEDMDGQFLGGGAVDHAVKDGDIYLSALDLANLFLVTGLAMGEVAIELDDAASGAAAHMVLTISEKLDELRSELLKREIELSFNLD